MHVFLGEEPKVIELKTSTSQREFAKTTLGNTRFICTAKDTPPRDRR